MVLPNYEQSGNFAILKVDVFTKLKTEKVRKLIKIEKFILKTKTCDDFSSASMERAPKNYPQKYIHSKAPKIELDGFTKSGPSIRDQLPKGVRSHNTCIIKNRQFK